jgi:disulfide oxidoreductase YuzD
VLLEKLPEIKKNEEWINKGLKKKFAELDYFITEMRK